MGGIVDPNLVLQFVRLSLKFDTHDTALNGGLSKARTHTLRMRNARWGDKCAFLNGN